MTDLASEIRSMVGERAPARLGERQTTLVSLKACETHTDLAWSHLETIHDIADHGVGLTANPFKGYPLDSEGEVLFAEVLPEAFSLRIRAGYGRCDLRRGLTMASK